MQTMSCTEDDAPDASPTSSTAATTTSPADPLLAACDHFRTTWIEFAQIYSGPHGMGDTTPDPHGVRADEAVHDAFEAAQRGPADVQALGSLAANQYAGNAPGDFWDTVGEFFELCGQEPPAVRCEERTACESADLDRWTVPARQPDVTGVFHLPDPPEEPEGPWVEISAETDQYFRHALLDLSTAVVVGTAGTMIPAASIEDGSQVQVWTGGCHERNPVECVVQALRVVDP